LQLPKLGPFLFVMVLAQAIMSMCFTAAGVLAPVVAPALGVSTAAVGPYAAGLGLASLVGGMFIDGVLRRHGGARTMQVSIVFTAAGVLLAATGVPALVVLSCVVLGLGGGMLVPAAIVLLAKVAPPHKAGIVFAINQCGVPVGFGLSGVLFPLLLQYTTWQVSLCITAALVLAMVPLIQPMRAALDQGRSPGARLGGRALIDPMRLAWRERRLRLLGWMAFSLTVGQIALLAHMVSYLKVEIGFSHVQAGGALFLSQMGALVVRLAFGWLLDRIGRYWLVLGVMAMASGASALALAGLAPHLTYIGMCVMAAVAGGCMMGWNAIYFAAVSRMAPEGRAGTAVGGTQIFTATGSLVGPLLVSAVLKSGGSYALGFCLVALFALGIGVRLLRADVLERRARA